MSSRSQGLLRLEVQLSEAIVALAQARNEQESSTRNATAQALLRNLQKQIEEARDEADAIVDPEEQLRLERELSVHEREVETYRSKIRAANLKALSNQKKSLLKQREELFRGHRQRRDGNGDDASSEEEEEIGIAEESSKINASVHRLRSGLSGLTEHGNAAEEGSRIITDVIDEHGRIESELETAKKLTANIKMRETMDRMLLALAMLFYVSVCTYIIVARLHVPVTAIFGSFTSIFGIFGSLFSFATTLWAKLIAFITSLFIPSPPPMAFPDDL